MDIKKTRNPKVSIILVTFNAFDFTKKCIASVKKYSKDYELIVVDNGSRAEAINWLKKQTSIRKIFNFENRGFAAANNQGIKISRGKHILLLNSDTIVTEDWLARLIRPIEKDDKVGIVGPFSNYANYEQKLAVSYSSIRQMQAFAKDFTRREKLTFHISGFCMMIKRSVIDKVGLFDERFKIGNCEDVDFCIMAMRAGFKLKIASCFIHHFGSRSFIENINRINVEQVYIENNKILRKKWPHPELKRALPGRF